MTVVKSEFLLALNQVAAERNIPAEDVLSSIEQALVAAYKKEYPEVETSENISAKINRQSGEAHLFEDDKDITPPGFVMLTLILAKLKLFFQKKNKSSRKNTQ
ncbi:MAG: hypothetical protein NTV98_00935 [Candidatus Roizmanbacteria bacterium]|nr:hypothetical protein [Candidatus Roizmanbacteria bacterium]